MTSFSLGLSALIGKYLICKQYRQVSSVLVRFRPGPPRFKKRAS